ncbi:uncharacterized protein CXorf49 isoform X2 [Oryctolagus cuniculus]|uniref:uncharacterized protein CXorf49 isoform X2 n=1 Tax=Oryctolagus cuniculus TaxID=9986 RepID=UPI0004913193|nr:uncharacterized protein CXorf49 isoform X2 [Oryctolagus cuniculus]
MSSHSGASGFSDGSGPEREEQTAAGGGGASRAAAAGLVWGPAGSGEGQPRCEGGGDGGPSSVQAPKWQLASDRGAEVQPQMAQAGAGVLWGAEGPPGTPVLEGEGTGAPASQVAEGCAGPERPLSGPGDGARRRLPSAEAAAILARVEAGGGGRGVLGASCEEFLQACAAPLQRQATAPREAAGLLPFCTSLLGKPSTAFPWGRKPSKQGGAGKKAQARRKSQAVETRESGAKRDPVPGAHFLSSRPPTSYQHRGEFSSGVPTPQEVRALRNLQSLLQSSGAVPPRGRARSGDQEPPVRPRRPAVQQLPPGIEGCPRCVVLQKEVEDLKEELEEVSTAILMYITKKFGGM